MDPVMMTKTGSISLARERPQARTRIRDPPSSTASQARRTGALEKARYGANQLSYQADHVFTGLETYC
jgi:hypothetical protein